MFSVFILSITKCFFLSTATTYSSIDSINITHFVSILEIVTERFGKSLDDVVASLCRRFEYRVFENFLPPFLRGKI